MPVDRREDKDPPKNDRTDLEVWMRVKGPEFLQKNVANIVLGIAVLVAAGFFLYSRLQSKRAESAAVQQNVAAAYDFSTQLRQTLANAAASDLAGRERQQRAHDAVATADDVLRSDVATSAQKAIAQLAKADVFWQLANAPATALATSQPVSTFSAKQPDAYLDDAESAYTAILGSYVNEPEAVGSALLGLAAIAENRGKFDEAATWYKRAVDEASIRPAYRDAAKARLAMLDQLRRPIVLATPATAPTATMPATAPVVVEREPPATFPLLGEPAPTTVAATTTAVDATPPAVVDVPPLAAPTTTPIVNVSPTTTPAEIETPLTASPATVPAVVEVPSAAPTTTPIVNLPPTTTSAEIETPLTVSPATVPAVIEVPSAAPATTTPSLPVVDPATAPATRP